MDGGGGTSTGGVYSVSGTIGQPDAGTMSGGTFTLDGGFWGVVAAIQTPGAPLLSVTRTATNTVVVSWPAPAGGWLLHAATNLVTGGNGWTEIPPPYQTNGLTNDGWFHFRVRHPQPLAPPREFRLRFELAFDNPYAFPSGPLQLNRWWVEGTWDWEAHDGRRVYTPMFRLKDLAGAVGPWQHIAETNVHPAESCTNAGRHYRCLFDQVIPAVPWREIEVAQNLPYTLDDRERFLNFIRTNYLPRRPDLCIRKQPLGYGGLHYATNRPPAEREHNELYAFELFRTNPLMPPCTPFVPNNKIVVFLAGMDYEPAGNWVAEGVALEIIEHWNTPGFDYRNQASYVIIPIANPDAYEWGIVHVVPYGNGYGGTTNLMLNGYGFLESTNAVRKELLP